MLVVDDDSAFVKALSALLSTDDGIELVGTAANGEEAVVRALWLRPDVVTMDLEMPLVDGVEATRRIRATVPGTRVVVVSGSAYADRAESARAAGASAYLSKSRAADELVATIHAVAHDQNFIAAF